MGLFKLSRTKHFMEPLIHPHRSATRGIGLCVGNNLGAQWFTEDAQTGEAWH